MTCLMRKQKETSQIIYHIKIQTNRQQYLENKRFILKAKNTLTINIIIKYNNRGKIMY